MSATSKADYPTLGFDPAPGDTDAVATISTTLRNVYDAMNEISNVLHGAADGEWRGGAAIAFRDLLDDDVRPKIDTCVEAFDNAHSALSTWATSLDGYQSRAASYEKWAAEAQAEADAAQATLDGLPPKPAPGAPAPADKADRDKQSDDASSRTASTKALGEANDAVERYRGYARDMLRNEYEPEGRSHADKLKDAIDIAPEEPGWFSKAIDSIGDFVDTIKDKLDDLDDWVIEKLHELAPLLQAIGDIAGLLSGILGLLSLIPFLAPFCGPAALALAGVALLTHYAARVGETGSFGKPFTEAQFWLDSASVVLGATGLGIGAKMSRLAVSARGTGATAPTFFKLIQGGTYTATEMNYLLGSWKVTQASTILDGLQAPGGVQSTIDTMTGKKPMTQGPVVR
ncbi:MAG: hypothetical protein JWP56_539 [Aeromicrobium sp.]|nr:hypothetical protein [Aeromicrobium sp.]